MTIVAIEVGLHTVIVSQNDTDQPVGLWFKPFIHQCFRVLVKGSKLIIALNTSHTCHMRGA